jgi:hypothetical protein
MKDNRPDWRDPEMPVYARKYGDDGKIHTVLISPREAQAAANARFWQACMHPEVCPNWRDDPTYDLRKKGIA